MDEALSENVTTQYGGFYINCGALELKNIKVQSDDDTDSIHGNNKKYKVHIFSLLYTYVNIEFLYFNKL